MHRTLPTVAAASVLAVAIQAQSFQQLLAPQGIHNVPRTTAGNGQGCCVADFDGDGDIDVVLATPFGGDFLFFRNDGGLQFTDVSASSGLGMCLTVRCLGAADVDNDGDADLFVGNDGVPSQLFINNGGNTFTEESNARGIFHFDSNYSCSFGDYDNDGWLDLYCGIRTSATTGLPDANILYRNLGGGVFTDVTAQAGVGDTRPTLVAVWMDYDEDGWVDLCLANDKGNTFGPNEMYRNNGDGTFTAVGAQIGTDIVVDGMAIDFVDAFNDGGVDFYCTDLAPDHLFQLWDPNSNTYLDATYTYGLEGGAIGWAANWLDYDNDGWQDLHVVQQDQPNLLFQNPAAPAASQVQWPDQGQALGVGVAYRQYCSAIADFDNDGRLDILDRYHNGPAPVTAPDGVDIYHNQVAGGNWLKFRARGRVSNRDGFGARFEVTTGSLLQRQWVRHGCGYQTGSDTRLNFGLGTATQADMVKVRWPSGQEQFLTDVPANQIVEVVEPTFAASGPAQVGQSTDLEVSIPGDAGLVYLVALSFSATNTTTLAGNKVIPLEIDGLTALTLDVGNPLLPAPIGVLDATGGGTSTLFVPPLPFLAGLTFYATATTIDTVHFPLLRTVFPEALAITVQ